MTVRLCVRVHLNAWCAAAIEHMRKEAAFFGAMFEQNEFEPYVMDMANPKTWGDELTLRAVADAGGVVVGGGCLFLFFGGDSAIV